MLTPISWLRDYVDIDIPAEALAERLTLAGLEVAHIHYIGLSTTTNRRYPSAALRSPRLVS